jgi:flagellin
MGLRIATNIASETVQSNLKKVSSSADQSLSKLSSGKRIVKAADDAAGLAIAKNLEAQVKGLRQATRNANNGISLVQTAEGGLNESTQILTRLRELTVQASSDTVGEAERGFLNQEYQQLLSEADRIAESTTFNGMKLINGEGQGEMEFQVGANAGEMNRITFDSDQTNASIDNLGVSGTTIETKDDARDAISGLDEAIEKVNGFRATLGSVQSRLQSTVSNLEVQTVNQEAARSGIEDVDVAYESSKLAASNIVKQSGISTLAQANGLPNSALRLLG